MKKIKENAIAKLNLIDKNNIHIYYEYMSDLEKKENKIVLDVKRSAKLGS